MYLDPFALRITLLAAAGGLLLAMTIFLAEDARGVFWRKAFSAACLIAGVLALILAVAS